jgi:hypothetical protein
MKIRQTATPILKTMAALALAVALLGLSVAGAAAQTQSNTTDEQPEQNDTTEQDSDDRDDQADQQETQIYSQLGDLQIHGVTIVDDSTGRISVTWTGRAPETVRYAQIDGDSQQIAMSSTRLLPGEKTNLTVDIVDKSEPAMIWTQQSLRENRFDTIRWQQTSSRTITALEGLLYGGSTMLIGTLLMAWRVKNTHSDPGGW